MSAKMRPPASRLHLTVLGMIPFGIPTFARAAFVNNVEHFDGTVKDTSTWTEYRSTTPDVIRQNNQLIVDSLRGDIAEYRSRFVSVGVGGFVEVSARMTAFDTEGADVASMYLVLNTPAPASAPFAFASRAVSVESDNSPRDFYGFEYVGDPINSHGSGIGLDPAIPFAINQTYILRLDYLTSSTVEYRVYNSNRDLLGSATRDLTNLPPQLGVTIGSYLSTAVFDDLTIGGNASVPEPSGAVVVFGALLILRRRPVDENRLTLLN